MSWLARAMWERARSEELAQLRAKVARWRDEREAERGPWKESMASLNDRVKYAEAERRSLESSRQQAWTRLRNVRTAAAVAASVRPRTAVARDGTRVIFPRVPPKTRTRA